MIHVIKQYIKAYNKLKFCSTFGRKERKTIRNSQARKRYSKTYDLVLGTSNCHQHFAIEDKTVIKSIKNI